MIKQIALFGALAAGYGLIFWVILTSPAMPHEWYPNDCCSGQDCFPQPGGVTATQGGWRIESSGEVVPYDDLRIRPFPEDAPPADRSIPHVCYLMGDTGNRALCVYVPEVGS